MTTMTLRVNKEDAELIKKFADTHDLSLSDFARQAMLEKIEDDYDLAELRKAMAADNGKHYSMTEVKKELDF
ncbi:type II toxin-antitoxin system RelB family antitoxin [Leuconostoc citreum]|uniref:type II toxin-antitoxin system RelB family antitoxin n=1 Tax=Leuconostoc citreum TaxID=33964 RepID=UPI0032E0348C